MTKSTLLTAFTMSNVGLLAASEKPNIILILADDMGYNDLGFNGSYIETPNMDDLAMQGVRMESFYTCPVSSPTRVGTLTGRYPIRMGMMRSVIPPMRDFGIPTSEILIPEMLANAGYNHRGMIGKWHVGHLRYEWLPMQRGFTHFVGCHNGAIDYFTKDREGELDWHDGNAPLPEKGYVTDLIGKHAVNFIKDVPKDEPYFLYLPFTAPHSPFQAKEKDIKKYLNLPGVKDKKAATYAAMVDNLDQNIGRVVDAARKRGDLDNTLIIFYSDNGGVPQSLPTKMRAGKFSTYEGGVRVVAFANWPDGGITGGRQIDSRMGYIDIYPTIKAAAYGDDYTKVKDKNPIDGINVLPMLRGKSEGEPRYWFSYIDQNQGAIERFGINYGNYKLYVERPAADNKAKEKPKAKIELYELDAHHATEHEQVKNPKMKKQLLQKVNEFMGLRPEVVIDRYHVPNKGFIAPKDWTIKPDK